MVTNIDGICSDACGKLNYAIKKEEEAEERYLVLIFKIMYVD